MKIRLISNYRNHLMALAMLWIAIFHATMWFPIKAINFIVKTAGYGGLDIFLFLSGFGLYYSYKKNSNYINFIIKRVIRILPSFIPAIIIACAYYGYSITDTLLELTMLRFWIFGDLLLWFVPAIMVLYLFFPGYMKLFTKNPLVVTICFVILSIMFSFLFWEHSLIIFFTRIPIFIIGIYFGYLGFMDRQINNWGISIIISLCLLGFCLLFYFFHTYGSFMWSHGLYWYPFILIVPGVIILLCLILNHISVLKKQLYYLGTISFEFYLFHELFIKLFINLEESLPNNSYGILYNLLIIILTLTFSLTYKYMIQLCSSRLTVFLKNNKR